MTKYDSMSRDELIRERTRLKDLLDEVNEEREMILFGTTGLHRSVAHHVEHYARELAEIQEQINYISSLI